MSKYKECEFCGAALDLGEKCDCGEGEALPAIQCTQPPIIVENLDSVRQNLETILAGISILPHNDENLKYVKQIRADLSKDFEQMENQRKAAKRLVMEPYDAANEKYQEYVATPYKEADGRLKKWVDDYQGGLKQKCADGLREYFDELCRANSIDFLPFHRCGVVVDMAMARQKEPKKAMEKIYNFVMAVRADMDTILKMPRAEEIMAEYRNFPVLSAAVSTVEKREQEKTRMAAFLEQQRRQQEEQATMRAALEEAAPEIQPEPEEKFSVCFQATGTISALRAMKSYALTLGITFEEINQEEENDE